MRDSVKNAPRTHTAYLMQLSARIAKKTPVLFLGHPIVIALLDIFIQVRDNVNCVKKATIAMRVVPNVASVLMGLFRLPIKLTVDVQEENSGISGNVIVICVLQINGALKTKQNAPYVRQILCLFQVHQIVTVPVVFI